MENFCKLCKQPISPDIANKMEQDIQNLVDKRSNDIIQEEKNKLELKEIKLEEEQNKLNFEKNKFKEEEQKLIEQEKIKLNIIKENEIKQIKSEANEQLAREINLVEEKANSKLLEKEQENQSLELRNKRALKEIEDAKNELDAAQKKLETKQADITGQIGQDNFVKLLREAFPSDSFKETNGGIKEADIIHTIRENNVEYGTLICYDVKKEKTPNLKDIENAKSYREIHGTFYSIIIASSMPVQEIPNKFIGKKNNVLIIHSKISIEVIKIIRNNLIMIEQSKNSVKDRDSKQAKLVEYILGQDFQTRISSLFYSIQKFNKLLELEERQFNKAKKEKLAIIKELKSSLKITDEISEVIETEIKIKSVELELDQIETE